MVLCFLVGRPPQLLAETIPAFTSTPTQNLKEKPVSVSYMNVIKCYPGLENESLALKVDLNQLKEDIDKKFITSQSLLRYRQVLLKDANGLQKRLKISAKPAKKSKFNYLLSLEKLDSKGAGTPLEISPAQRLNPSQKELDQYFLNQEVLEDERSYFDTKLNGLSLSFKRNFSHVYELELSEATTKKRLACEDQKDLGIVCTCFQK
ncbi:MAG: hypothetical protein ACXVBQ_02950 [Pseudobdellovibrionaceae bacterium]